MRRLCAVIVSLLLVGTAAQRTQASFHLWRIVEAYSSADGTVQFIQMEDPFAGENLLMTFGAFLSSTDNLFPFDHNLVGDTTNKRVLIATPGYDALAAATGLPPADYHLPMNNFFSTSGDSLNFDNLNVFTFSAGQLPLDGIGALHHTYGGSAITAGKNTIRNFNNTTGSIPEPAAGMTALFTVVLALRRRPEHP